LLVKYDFAASRISLGGLAVITLRLSFLAAVLVQTCFSANLAVSTYFKDGFTPTAIASDTQGNILVAGSAVIDPWRGPLAWRW
jgi:hypothetical protein